MVPDGPAALLRACERIFRRSSGASSIKFTPFEGLNFAEADLSWSFVFVSEWIAIALRLADDLRDVDDERDIFFNSLDRPELMALAPCSVRGMV